MMIKREWKRRKERRWQGKALTTTTPKKNNGVENETDRGRECSERDERAAKMEEEERSTTAVTSSADDDGEKKDWRRRQTRWRMAGGEATTEMEERNLKTENRDGRKGDVDGLEREN